MLAHLLVHSEVSKREEGAESILLKNGLSKNHSGLLWFGAEEKLGVEQAKQIREFLSFRPFEGTSQAVVLLTAENLTPDAQNALLKTLEEPPKGAILILGVSSEDQLLPTVLSRCQVINLTSSTSQTKSSFDDEIKKLLDTTMEKRFQFIEKLDKKEEFLFALTAHFRKQLFQDMIGVATRPPGRCTHKMQRYLNDLIEAERWANQNVNIRAILEYLMLKMPE